MNMGKLRPQIFLAITVLGILAVIATYENIPEIATATTNLQEVLQKLSIPNESTPDDGIDETPDDTVEGEFKEVWFGCFKCFINKY